VSELVGKGVGKVCQSSRKEEGMVVMAFVSIFTCTTIIELLLTNFHHFYSTAPSPHPQHPFVVLNGTWNKKKGWDWSFEDQNEYVCLLRVAMERKGMHFGKT
jgi:hypothetical protein